MPVSSYTVSFLLLSYVYAVLSNVPMGDEFT
jgi:hypothetical protein